MAPLTVAELIEQLQKCPPNAHVFSKCDWDWVEEILSKPSANNEDEYPYVEGPVVILF